MTDQDSSTKRVVTASLLASGFPFQTAIAGLVRRVVDCSIEKEEFPWRDDMGVVRFLDLVVSKHNFFIAIECKKTEKEIFTFLQPTASGSSQQDVIRARSLYRTQTRNPIGHWEWELCCGDWDIRPKSPESAFCVLSTSDSGKDQRLLEKDAQLLIGGADAFGNYLVREPKRALGDMEVGDDYRVIVPVIVTNAKLFAVRYDPESLSLETGQLPIAALSDISLVASVRFRKAFTASNPDGGDRTVFVVAATSLLSFLQGLDYSSERPSPRDRLVLWQGQAAGVGKSR